MPQRKPRRPHRLSRTVTTSPDPGQPANTLIYWHEPYPASDAAQDAILAKHPDYTSAQLHNAEDAQTASLIIGALITMGLWLWMARANGKGLNWARIAAAVFFGINTLDLLLSFFLVHAAATVIVSVIVWLVGLGAILLLFSRESAPFYKQQAGA